jgi:hypothetical protein
MKLKSIQQSILAAALLSTSLFAFASNEQIVCPSADLIKQSWQKLDTVSVIGATKFAVWSLDSIKDTNYSWHITTFATANDLNTALVIGQDNVKNITGQKDRFAVDMKDVYLCGYFSPTEIMGVAAISFKNENEKFKFASFDLKSLNTSSH